MNPDIFFFSIVLKQPAREENLSHLRVWIIVAQNWTFVDGELDSP